MTNINCALCDTVKKCEIEKFPLQIHEFEFTYLILGSHQFYRGYSVLVSKQHIRELHELDATSQTGIFQELMYAGSAINVCFKPWKLNYACYGNQVEHIHWHIIPRYLSDAKHREEPFSNSSEFEKFPSTSESAKEDLQLIKTFLAK